MSLIRRAETRSLWHITARRNFRPSVATRPITAGGWAHAQRPLLYATTSPFYWHEISGGGMGPYTRGRKWAAELELLPAHPPVPREDPLQPQSMLDPRHVRVKRIIPVEEAIAEETGWLCGVWVGADYHYEGQR